jgi:tRNA A-37 threonylcarbamoyl transferase component Bud32
MTKPADASVASLPEAKRQQVPTHVFEPSLEPSLTLRTPSPPAVQVPTVPGYVIIGEIARGGMGCVLEGRELALDREVAIKVLLPGADASRFILEAKITARLPHPSIPPVHALGKLADGSPFLAMKRIRGRTLGEELKARANPAADLSRFVQIFEQVCQAVGFAHSRGIIHRDLKPANIMVGEFGEVQVMDWGLAKDHDAAREGHRSTGTMDVDTHDKTPPGTTASGSEVLTQAGTIMGTPGYMAPEQARGEAVDARADVYALGGILAEILTGQMLLSGNAMSVLFRVAAGAEATEALARLDACGADAELIALAKACLAAEAAARPADARAVAALVAEYRQGVAARVRRAEIARAQAETQVSEQRKRRRVIQWSSSAIAAVLLAGLAASLWQMTRAIDAELLATKERDAKEQERQRAEAHERLAKEAASAERRAKEQAQEERDAKEQERKYAQAIADFVQNDFLALSSLESQHRIGWRPAELAADLTMRQMLDRAAEKLRERRDLDPRIEAKLWWMIGVNYRAHGAYREASAALERCVPLRQKAYGPVHPETTDALNSLAVVYLLSGRTAEAIRMLEQARNANIRNLGQEHPTTLTMLHNLAGAYSDDGRMQEAVELFEHVLKAEAKTLGPNHPDTVATRHSLAVGYMDSERYPDAIRLFEQVREWREANLGADHFDTWATLHMLARAYLAVRRGPEAVRLLDQVCAKREAKLGTDHPKTLSAQNDLAMAFTGVNRVPEAIRLYEQVRKGRVAKLGADHPDTLATTHDLALTYSAVNQLPEAIRLYEQARAGREAKLGINHPATLATLNGLAAAYWRVGRLDKSLPLLEVAFRHREATLGRQHRDTQQTMANLGVNYKDAGRLAEALPLLEEAYAFLNHGSQLNWVGPPLLEAYVRAGLRDKATMLTQELVTAAREKLPPDSPQLAATFANFSAELLQVKAFADAEALLRDCLAIRQKTEPQAWTTFNAMSMLGEALQRQGKHAQAEQLLLQGYGGMKAREKSIPKEAVTRLAEALDRLIALYTARGKPDEAKKWQTERDRFQTPIWTVW